MSGAGNGWDVRKAQRERKAMLNRMSRRRSKTPAEAALIANGADPPSQQAVSSAHRSAVRGASHIVRRNRRRCRGRNAGSLGRGLVGRIMDAGHLASRVLVI
jgi:hypothetical protein